MPRLREPLTQTDYRELASAYRVALAGPGGEAVLADLADFCCAFRSTWAGDRTLMMEGRREVWIRIAALLELDVKDYGRLMGTLARTEDEYG